MLLSTSYFVLTKIQFQIMELLFQFLISFTVTLFLTRLKSVYHSLQYIPAEVWNYSQANVENIKYAISNFDWSKAFENLSVDEKVKHLYETLLNIFRNYIPNKKNQM